MTFKPSKYQKAIFNHVKDGKTNIIIQAVAGSGKTTTIVEAAKLIPADAKSIFVAFNKSIATELSERLPSNIECRTLHSFGMGMFYSNINRRPRLDTGKLEQLMIQVLEANSIDEFDGRFGPFISMMNKIIPLLKADNVNYSNYNEVQDTLLNFNIEYELTDELFEIIIQVMNRCKSRSDVIDFDDMIWIPIVNNFCLFSTYDYVFIDELQDLSAVQFELIKKMCGNNTKIIGVGDRQQAIYAFRGADSNSMDNFKEHFNCVELPLSICYRCPKSHIEIAKQIVPSIEAYSEAEEGIFEEITFEKSIINAIDKDLYLCRTNAPLIKIAFALIRADKKAIIRGRNIGAGLIKMINKYKVNNLNDLLAKITRFKNLQIEKLELIELGQYDKRRKNSLLSAIDSCDTLLVIGENVQNIESLKFKINQIFSDQIEGIVCSSIHKAKGLEANRVTIVNYDNMPHPMAKTEQELQQEYNIKYVALTRAKKELRILKSQDECEE